jgi:hypothetical protein
MRSNIKIVRWATPRRGVGATNVASGRMPLIWAESLEQFTGSLAAVELLSIHMKMDVVLVVIAVIAFFKLDFGNSLLTRRERICLN